MDYLKFSLNSGSRREEASPSPSEGGEFGRGSYTSPSPSKRGEIGSRGNIESMNSPFGASSSPSFGGVRGGVFGGTKGGYLLLLFLFIMSYASAQFNGGSGTEADPYTIATPAQLAQLATLVNAADATYAPAGVYYKLVGDIDLSGYQADDGWIPIGHAAAQPFRGVFDGNSKTVTGLKINNANTARPYVGLFGYAVVGTIIKNFGIVNAEIVSTPAVATTVTGGVVGYNNGGSIRELFFTGSITSSATSTNFTGGIAGYSLSTANITNCYTMGSINASGNTVSAGGIVGRNVITIEACWTTVEVNANANTTANAGGIVGDQLGNNTLTNTKNCVALNPCVKSTGATHNIGRIVGNITAGTFTNNIALSNMINLPDGATWNNIGATLKDGADITLSEIIADGTLGNRFTSPIWITENGKLPGLGMAVTPPSFLTGGSMICGISILPSEFTIRKGESKTLTATILGFNSIGGVTWDVEGCSAGTVISSTGTLTVANNETESEFKVIATSTEDNSKKGTANVLINNNVFDGEGTENDPFIINTSTQLAQLATFVNEGNIVLRDKHYKLGNNINLSDFQSGTGWIPIGNDATNSFGGVFDGDNHTITGLYIHHDDLHYAGLFGYIINSTIKNVSIVDMDIELTSNLATITEIYAGAIAGYAATSNIFINCNSTGLINITNTKGSIRTGGLIGYCQGGKMSQCWSLATINAISEVPANNMAPCMVGGLSGIFIGTTAETTTVSNCYYKGDIKAFGSTITWQVGGLTCSTNNAEITNCWSAGTVTVIIPEIEILPSQTNMQTMYVGGITGQVTSGGLIKNCYSTSIVKGVSMIERAYVYVGGIAGLKNATLEDNVALNPIIICSGGRTMYRSFGRVAGRTESGGTIANNAAFADMFNPFGGTEWNNVGVNLRDGADLSLTDILNDGTFDEKFTFENGWTTQKGKLPGFGTTYDFYVPGDPLVVGVFVEDIGVAKGSVTTLEAFVAGFNNPTGAVTWSLEGGDVGTGITSAGILTIAAGETAKILKVTATSTEDNTKSGSAFIAILSGGSGTESDPYIITTADELATVAELVNKNTDFNNQKYYKLGNDIDLSEYGENFNNGAGWIPIGTDNIAFKGTFDGDGYVIRGLYFNIVTAASSRYRIGLFSETENATIKNLGVEDVFINCTSNLSSLYISGLVPYSENNSTIDNCYVTGSINAVVSVSPTIGGIMGTNLYGAGILNCHTNLTINLQSSAGDSYLRVGGIVGYTNAPISNCYSICSINTLGSATSEHNIGGIVGYKQGSTISNCYSTCSIEAITEGAVNAGGISGYCFTNSTVSQSWADVTINVTGNSATANTCAGGIVGLQAALTVVTNCYSKGSITVNAPNNIAYSGGIVGNNSIIGYVINCWSAALIKAYSDSDARTGGISGGNTSITTNNSAALNPQIVNESAAKLFGRIAGINESYLENNIGFEEMVNPDGETTWENIGANQLDGATISRLTINTDGTLGGLFTEEDGWAIEDGKLPGFGQPVDMPLPLLIPEGSFIVSGKVTESDNITGIANVEITLSGHENHTATTDESGNYTINDVHGGLGFVYKVEAKKFGYLDYEGSILVTNDTENNIILNKIPTYIVSGIVSDSNNTNGIEGVSITLKGYKDYSVLTDVSGNFIITDVYDGFTYSLIAIKAGYTMHTTSIKVNGNDETYNFSITEVLFPVANVEATIEGNNAKIEWVAPVLGIPANYVLDDGTCEGGLSINPNANQWLGNIFTVGETGVLTSIDLYGRSRAGYDPSRMLTVEIFNESFQSVGQSAPFIMPEDNWINIPLNNIPYSGVFYAMVRWPNQAGYTNYLGWDENGTNAQSDFSMFYNGTSFYTLKYTSEGKYICVFMIRANASVTGKSNSITSYGAKITSSGTNYELCSEVSSSEFRVSGCEILMPKATTLNFKPETLNYSNVPETLNDSRSLLNYKVYRLKKGQPETNWTEVVSNITATEYTDAGWSGLEWGEYQYAVKVVYSSGISQAQLSNVLLKDVYADYRINIATNAGVPTGAIVTLSSQDHVYTAISDANGVYFNEIWKGVYNLTVKLFGYEVYTLSNISITTSGLVRSVDLKEIIFPLREVTAVKVDNKVVVEWEAPVQTVETTYILDDGTDANGYAVSSAPNGDAGLGNMYTVGDAGFITSVDVYGQNNADNTNRIVHIRIYNEAKKLVGQSEGFVLPSNAWINVPLNNVQYSGIFYAFVYWSQTSGASNYLGYSRNGLYVNAYVEGNGEIAMPFHPLVNPPEQPGSFMIRVNADVTSYINSKSLMGYTVYRLEENQPPVDWTELTKNLTETSYTDTNWSTLDPGTYQYAVKAQYGSGLSDAVLSNPLEKINDGINKTELPHFSIHPNPVKDVLKIVRSTTDNARIEIYNTIGSLILIQQLGVNETNTNINVSSLSSGVYVIKIIEGQNNKTQRFVKK